MDTILPLLLGVTVLAMLGCLAFWMHITMRRLDRLERVLLERLDPPMAEKQRR